MPKEENIFLSKEEEFSYAPDGSNEEDFTGWEDEIIYNHDQNLLAAIEYDQEQTLKECGYYG
jgi:hypothetical protein